MTHPLLSQIVGFLDDKKAHDIRTLDLRDLASYADFMVICTAGSTTQSHALVSHLKKNLAQHLVHAVDSKNEDWCVLDFGDVIVHVMKDETRHFYDLEGLWIDAPVVHGSSF